MKVHKPVAPGVIPGRCHCVCPCTDGRRSTLLLPCNIPRLRSGPLGDLPVKQRCLHQWPFSLPASPAGLECPCSCSGASSMSQELRLTNPGCGLQCSSS